MGRWGVGLNFGWIWTWIKLSSLSKWRWTMRHLKCCIIWTRPTGNIANCVNFDCASLYIKKHICWGSENAHFLIWLMRWNEEKKITICKEFWSHYFSRVQVHVWLHVVRHAVERIFRAKIDRRMAPRDQWTWTHERSKRSNEQLFSSFAIRSERCQ